MYPAQEHFFRAQKHFMNFAHVPDLEKTPKDIMDCQTKQANKPELSSKTKDQAKLFKIHYTKT